MVIRFHKISSIISAGLWAGLGILTIGSIAVSSLSWGINLFMGLIFLFFGWFSFTRGKHMHQFSTNAEGQLANDPNFRKFLRFDLMLVFGSCLLGVILLSAALFRVLGEGMALFG